MSTYRSGDLHATQDEVDRHNRRELWRDVENRLSIAEDSIEQALVALEDLGFSPTSPLYTDLSQMSARIAALHGAAHKEAAR